MRGGRECAEDVAENLKQESEGLLRMPLIPILYQHLFPEWSILLNPIELDGQVHTVGVRRAGVARVLPLSTQDRSV